MADAVWGGANAGRHDSRYYPQHMPAQAMPPGVTTAPQGVAAHLMAPREAYGEPQAGEGRWPAAPQGRGLAGILHGAGALLSLALIAGLGVWGYQLVMRDVTGVPVVRALAGPMRIQPDDPGGVGAAHQGLAVNTIAAEGQAEGPAAQVALAPAPAALEADDLPAHAMAEVSAVSMAEAGETVPAEALEAEPASLTGDEEGGVASALALANMLSAGALPLSGEAADLALTPEAEARLAVAVVPASVPGVARSPRPPVRPDEIVARVAASPVDLAVASAFAAALPGVRDVSATEIAAGTRLVQLGAFESEDVARAEWDNVALRFPEMLEGKDRVIEMAQSGGKTFYRLRAMGFVDIADARGFCAALTAGQAACIPVVTR